MEKDKAKMAEVFLELDDDGDDLWVSKPTRIIDAQTVLWNLAESATRAKSHKVAQRRIMFILVCLVDLCVIYQEFKILSLLLLNTNMLRRHDGSLKSLYITFFYFLFTFYL